MNQYKRQISEEVHRRGINIRHIGYLRSLLTFPDLPEPNPDPGQIPGKPHPTGGGEHAGKTTSQTFKKFHPNEEDSHSKSQLNPTGVTGPFSPGATTGSSTHDQLIIPAPAHNRGRSKTATSSTSSTGERSRSLSLNSLAALGVGGNRPKNSGGSGGSGSVSQGGSKAPTPKAGGGINGTGNMRENKIGNFFKNKNKKSDKKEKERRKSLHLQRFSESFLLPDDEALPPYQQRSQHQPANTEYNNGHETRAERIRREEREDKHLRNRWEAVRTARELLLLEIVARTAKNLLREWFIINNITISQ